LKLLEARSDWLFVAGLVIVVVTFGAVAWRLL
jgi:hypothetical protein